MVPRKKKKASPSRHGKAGRLTKPKVLTKPSPLKSSYPSDTATSEPRISTTPPPTTTPSTMARTVSTPTTSKPATTGGRVTKTTKKPKSATKPQKLAGELIPYQCFLEDNESFFEMVEKVTRPETTIPKAMPIINSTKTITAIKQHTAPASLADLAANALTIRHKKAKQNFGPIKHGCKNIPVKPKSKYDLPPQPCLETTFQLTSKIQVVRRGHVAEIENDDLFEVALPRKKWCLLKQNNSLPFNLYKGKRKEVKEKIIKRIKSNAKKVELLTLIQDNINFNVHIISEQAKTHKPDRDCLLYTSPSPRDKRQSRMPSSA